MAKPPTNLSPRKLRAPAGTDIAKAREKADLTQSQAGALVHSTARRWREWESGDYRMHPGLWELFLIRTQGVVMVEPADLKMFHEER